MAPAGTAVPLSVREAHGLCVGSSPAFPAQGARADPSQLCDRGGRRARRSPSAHARAGTQPRGGRTWPAGRPARARPPHLPPACSCAPANGCGQRPTGARASGHVGAARRRCPASLGARRRRLRLRAFELRFRHLSSSQSDGPGDASGRYQCWWSRARDQGPGTGTEDRDLGRRRGRGVAAAGWASAESGRLLRAQAAGGRAGGLALVSSLPVAEAAGQGPSAVGREGRPGGGAGPDGQEGRAGQGGGGPARPRDQALSAGRPPSGSSGGRAASPALNERAGTRRHCAPSCRRRPARVGEGWAPGAGLCGRTWAARHVRLA